MILILIAAPVFGSDESQAEKAAAGLEFGVIDQTLIPTAYSGGERFRYDISYTGGLKLGELHLELKRPDKVADEFTIHARVTTENGFFSKAYPIEDVHVTQVRGPDRLPFHYEVWQKEGYSYEAHRVTRYEQQQGKIFYQHNEKPVEIFEVKTPIQNEFSSFFASRIMGLAPGEPFLVPTFADEKRNEVVVVVRGRERLKKTIFGEVDTLVVEPIMKFSGLYDKRGDTVIWYSDDACRVPVRVNSKLVIGSLTAKLVSYTNPACPSYDGVVHKKYRNTVESAESVSKN
jgi:hypothetical protein